MKNNNNPVCEKVSFAFSYNTVEEALLADSAYVARALYDVALEKPSVASYIITEDDKSFIVAHVPEACAHIATRLAAYIAHDVQFHDEPYTFVLSLPSCRNVAIDSLILHELLRVVAVVRGAVARHGGKAAATIRCSHCYGQARYIHGARHCASCRLLYVVDCLLCEMVVVSLYVYLYILGAQPFLCNMLLFPGTTV